MIIMMNNSNQICNNRKISTVSNRSSGNQKSFLGRQQYSYYYTVFVLLLPCTLLFGQRASGFATIASSAAAIVSTGKPRNNYKIMQVTTKLFLASTEKVTDWDKINKKQEQFRKTHKNINSNIQNNSQSQSLNKKDDPEWKFFDTARINVTGGNGGNGCVAFRREKGVAMGGPAGGRGGNGGNVYIICNEAFNTLAPCRNRVHVRASDGINGQGKNRNGCIGNDEYITVPPGTVVRELSTNKVAGELKTHGETLIVARGGRGGRGNFAFKTQRYTAPKIAERGEPGASRWLSLELKLVADVGFLGMPNAGKSTLLAASSNAKPKIANYPFTTIVPNLGVCDFGNIVLCDIPGLIEGASSGVGLGYAFLRHVQRCKVLLHVVDGTSDDPIQDFNTINQELKNYDEFLAKKPQVVVLNKIDVSEVSEKQEELIAKLKEAAGHSRVLPISAATTKNVEELMGRLKKFVDTQPEAELPEPPQVDFSKAGLDGDSDDFVIMSDPAYPGQWRVKGEYIEQVAKMTHWEYPEAVERFGRQLSALGIAQELERRGAVDGDLVMVDKYDFEFAPGMTNPYIPSDLLEKDMLYSEESVGGMLIEEPQQQSWTPFRSGGYLEEDAEELMGFNEDEAWDFLDETESDFDEYNMFVEGDDIWQS